MKYIFSSVFVLIINTMLTAQTTPVPDANFEAFLIAEGIDTNGITGDILNSDATNVTTLDVSVNNITDFSGLEAFVNILSLDLNGNQFATLPLSTLTNLEELRFSGNMALANLDLSANTQLKIIIARSNGNTNNAPITSLDLSSNTLLEEIEIYNFFNLSSVIYPNTNTVRDIYMLLRSNINVDFSDYDNLEHLFLSTNFNNSLTINALLPNNQNSLKTLSCQGGNITNVNVSNFLALEQLRLQTTNTQTIQLPQTNSLKDIRISNHLINTISFENAAMLETLYIQNKSGSSPTNIDITKNSQLKVLVARSNHMTNIDVTQNSSLTNINVQSNQLTSLDVTENKVLEELTASYNMLSDIDVRQNILLRRLALSNNEIANLDVTQNRELQNLNIANNLFTGTGLDITQNIALSSLDASNNQIESLNITKNSSLGNLVLHHNLFTGTNIIDQYHDIWQTNGALRASDELDVSYNLLSGKIPDFASLALDGKTNYFELKFDNNHFHFGDFEDEHNTYVQLLSTYWTKIPSIVLFRKYTYAPQAKVNSIESYTPNVNDTITLNTTVRGNQNNYQWFKNGTAIPDAPNEPNLILYNVSECDNGVYHCEITSDLVPFENNNPPGTNGKNLLLIRNDITVDVQGTNKSCTSVVNPANDETGVPINTGLEWKDDFGACGYLLSVGTNAEANNLLSNIDVGKTSNYNFSNNLAPNTTYNVIVVPYFSDGPLNSGCTIQSFTTGGNITIPECNELSLPAPSAADVAVSTHIEWTRVNGADGYYLNVGTSAGNTDIVNNINITGGNNNSYDIPSDLPSNTVIYVNILPYNAEGTASGCKEFSFTTETIATIPNCTSITSPLDGATDVSISENISWDAVQDADGYYINIGTTAGENDLVNNTDLTTTTTTYSPATDFPENTTIYVSVTPYNVVGSATGCTEISFTTETIATIPNCTTISSPVDGATDVSTNEDINWDAVQDADGYYINIGTNPGGNDLVNNTDLTTTSYTPTTDFPENTTIYVSVTPYNAVGNATGCTEISFATETIATIPNCTTISSPVDGATEVSISENISWDAVQDADGYYINIGTNPEGNDLVNNTDLTTTSYTPTTDFPENTTIYVSVTPYNVVGSATGCTEINFTTETIAAIPNCTTITSPVDGATEVSISENISWDAVQDADGYYIKIGTNPGGNDLVNNTDLTTTSYSPTTDFPENTTIYVSVTPYNAIGNATGCPEISFTTETIATIPNCTTISSPVDGATDVSTN
ncbi:immunoglobulin domain-containing protein, partial [Salegentibacter maritimus]